MKTIKIKDLTTGDVIRVIYHDINEEIESISYVRDVPSNKQVTLEDLVMIDNHDLDYDWVADDSEITIKEVIFNHDPSPLDKLFEIRPEYKL